MIWGWVITIGYYIGYYAIGQNIILSDIILSDVIILGHSVMWCDDMRLGHYYRMLQSGPWGVSYQYCRSISFLKDAKHRTQKTQKTQKTQNTKKHITIGCYRVSHPNSAQASFSQKPQNTKLLWTVDLLRCIGKSLLFGQRWNKKDKKCKFCVCANTQGVGKDGHGVVEDFTGSNICPAPTSGLQLEKTQPAAWPKLQIPRQKTRQKTGHGKNCPPTPIANIYWLWSYCFDLTL